MSVLKKEVFMSEETRLAIIETNSVHIIKSIERIDKRLDIIESKVEDRISKIDSVIEKLDAKIDGMRNDLNSQFKWLLGVMITLFSGLYATAIGGMIARLAGWV